MNRLVRVRAVRPLNPAQGFETEFTFTTGETRVIDLDPYLRGGIFEPVRQSRELFCSMVAEDGSIAWPNGADICPDVLYLGREPAWWRNRDAPAAGGG